MQEGAHFIMRLFSPYLKNHLHYRIGKCLHAFTCNGSSSEPKLGLWRKSRDFECCLCTTASKYPTGFCGCFPTDRILPNIGSSFVHSSTFEFYCARNITSFYSQFYFHSWFWLLHQIKTARKDNTSIAAVSYTHLTLPTNREESVSWARRCV